MHTEEYKAKLGKLIIQSIQEGFDSNPSFHKTEILMMTVYRILTEIYVNEKPIIFIDAPTGTGKSIIGYMMHFCIFKIELNLFKENNPNVTVDDNLFTKTLTYDLTSSKMLQEQIEDDIKRFDLEHFSVLKGTSNYECKEGTKMHKAYTNFTNRNCKGMTGAEIGALACSDDCEYLVRRAKTSASEAAVVNYAYFLTVMNAKFNMYFGPRLLTIADEGHLIPSIVTSMYGIELTLFHINKLIKIYNGIELNFGAKLSDPLYEIKEVLEEHTRFFLKTNHTLTECLEYIHTFNNLCKLYLRLSQSLNDDDTKVFKEMFRKDFEEIEEKMIKGGFEKDKAYIDSLEKRPEDVFIQATEIGEFNLNIGNKIIPVKKYFKFMIRDMSEAEVTRKYFINHTKYLIIMSATIGSPDEFATLLGLDQSEYAGFMIPSSFDFSNSPIYLCSSGYLNYNNFDAKIDEVLYDACKICENLHPDHRGIIHTSTFKIAEMLQEKLRRRKNNFSRYLFYKTADEKEQCIKLMKSDTKIPYVIIGPSLYEGIDLKDDFGRFNIIVKAPYGGMDDYIRAKMVRFPFYYERETLEKLQQSLGRTNRHKTDWSITYCLDTSLNKLIYKLPDYITGRIQNKKL